MTAREGVIYVATGRKWIEEAIASVTTLRRHMPGVPVVLFSDRDDVGGAFDEVVVIDRPVGGYRDKILCLRRSPYDRTIFLDTDTCVTADLGELFRLLDRFDVAMAQDVNYELQPVKDVPASFPEYNTGVIAFRRSDAFTGLVDRCVEIYDEGVDGRPYLFDQPPMRRALYESHLRVATLRPEYNCQIRQMGCLNDRVKILHGRNTDLAAAGWKVNRAIGTRVFFNGIATSVRVKRHRFYWMKLQTALFMLRHHGPADVFRETKRFLFAEKDRTTSLKRVAEG